MGLALEKLAGLAAVVALALALLGDEGVVQALLVAAGEAAHGAVEAVGGVGEDREGVLPNQGDVVAGALDLLRGTRGKEE